MMTPVVTIWQNPRPISKRQKPYDLTALAPNVLRCNVRLPTTAPRGALALADWGVCSCFHTVLLLLTKVIYLRTTQHIIYE